MPGLAEAALAAQAAQADPQIYERLAFLSRGQPILAVCLYHAAEALRFVGILLHPIMPEKCGELLARLGDNLACVDDERQDDDGRAQPQPVRAAPAHA